MKGKWIFLWLNLISMFFAEAQHVMNSTLGSSGTTNYVNGHYYSHVIGQNSVQGTFVQNGMTIRQGFKQPLIHAQLKKINQSNLLLLPNEESTISLNVFPNPFLDNLTIVFSSASPFSTELFIYDIQGKIWFENIYPPLTKEIQLSDFKYLRPGPYMIRLIINHQPKTIAVMKHGI